MFSMLKEYCTRKPHEMNETKTLGKSKARNRANLKKVISKVTKPYYVKCTLQLANNGLPLIFFILSKGYFFVICICIQN